MVVISKGHIKGSISSVLENICIREPPEDESDCLQHKKFDMRPLAHVQVLALCILPTFANVEKLIFLAPAPVHIAPHQQPTFDNLQIDVLNSARPNLRLKLPASFAEPENPKGPETWFLIDRLSQHQRYEVRICWAATVGYPVPCFIIDLCFSNINRSFSFISFQNCFSLC